MMEPAEKKVLKIGEVSRLTGLPNRTLRYYERRGLVEPAARTQAGYRLYGQEEVARLEFINRAKLLGLTLGEIEELVSLAAEGSRGKVNPRLREILDSHLEEVERRMDELGDLRRSLLYYRHCLFEADPVESCDCGEEG